MRDLYIFGNGFDLAHKLKTRYWDFRCFLEENHGDFLSEFEKMYNIFPLDDTEPWYTEEAQKRWDQRVMNELWSQFEYKIGHPDIQSMLDFSQCILEDLYSEGLNYGIDDTMTYYWKKQYGFISKFSQYLKEWVSGIDLSDTAPIHSRLLNNHSDLFLNFNYTPTLQTVYHIENENVLHIHGGVKPYCDVTPIMGHGNTEDIQANREKEKEYYGLDDGVSTIYHAVSNYLTSILKNTDNIILQNRAFFENISDVEKIIVYGFSFAGVDLPYIDKILRSVSENAVLEIYYHSADDKDRFETALQQLGIQTSKYSLNPTSAF